MRPVAVGRWGRGGLHCSHWFTVTGEPFHSRYSEYAPAAYAMKLKMPNTCGSEGKSVSRRGHPRENALLHLVVF